MLRDSLRKTYQTWSDTSIRRLPQAANSYSAPPSEKTNVNILIQWKWNEVNAQKPFPLKCFTRLPQVTGCRHRVGPFRLASFSLESTTKFPLADPVLFLIYMTGFRKPVALLRMFFRWHITSFIAFPLFPLNPAVTVMTLPLPQLIVTWRVGETIITGLLLLPVGAQIRSLTDQINYLTLH